MTLFQSEIEALESLEPLRLVGTVVAVRGLTILVDSLPIPIGSLVSATVGSSVRHGEVVGFDSGRTVVMLFCSTSGVRPGERIVGERSAPTVNVGDEHLGRVVDALARPIDGAPAPVGGAPRLLAPDPAGALSRERIATPMPTGVRAIDAMLTVGKGQRLGVFAGPGFGKSTLLGSIARNTAADVNVIALIGERGREVRDFLESALGDDGLKRSVVVVSTSDESPLLRLRGMEVACAFAEHFRDQGADVMLMMDSITRYAQAQRQVGLAVGEPPATKGYPPSVFALLPRILERAGSMRSGGSITGFYTVLVEGDEVTDPIADAVRGVLDGHIVLSRDLTRRGHYPAIDVLASISRVADEVSDATLRQARRRVIRLLAAHRDIEDLVQIGAYARGSNVESDLALEMKPKLDAFLQQDARQMSTFKQTRDALLELLEQIGAVEQSLLKSKGPR